MDQNPRELNFNRENALYLILNIIGHDVIHDYSTPNDRWKQNIDYIKAFYSEYTLSVPTVVNYSDQEDQEQDGGVGEKRRRDDDQIEENDNKRQKSNVYLTQLEGLFLTETTISQEIQVELIMAFYFYLTQIYFDKKGEKFGEKFGGMSTIKNDELNLFSNEDKQIKSSNKDNNNDEESEMPELEDDNSENDATNNNKDQDQEEKPDQDQDQDEEQEQEQEQEQEEMDITNNDNLLINTKQEDTNKDVLNLNYNEDSLYGILNTFCQLTYIPQDKDQVSEQINNICQDIAFDFLNYMIHKETEMKEGNNNNQTFFSNSVNLDLSYVLNLLDKFIDFLQKDNVVLINIYENIFYNDNNEKSNENMDLNMDLDLDVDQEGGAKNKGKQFDLPSEEESIIIVNSVTAYLNDETFKQNMDDMEKNYNIFNEEMNKPFPNNSILGQIISDYKVPRGNITKAIETIFKDNNSFKLTGSLNLIPLIEPKGRVSRSNYLNIRDKTIEIINEIMQPLNDIIYNAEQLKLKLKEKQEREQAKIDEANRKLANKLAKEAKDEQSLSAKDKYFISQMMEFIAKSSLFMTKICDRSGKITDANIIKQSEFDIDNESALTRQIRILLSLAKWNKINKEINSTSLSQSLDDELFNDYWVNYWFGEDKNKNMKNNQCNIVNERYDCKKLNNKNYIINNSADIGLLNNNSFCPYTSILDGMSYCSYNTSESRKEYGNINFKIKSDQDLDLYYNGFLTIPDNNNPNLINIGFKVQLPYNNLILNSEQRPLNISNNKESNILTASVVIGKTLKKLLEFINEQDQYFIDGLFGNESIDFFGNLYNKAVNTEKENLEIFKTIFNSILFKGVGDLFQEINAVCIYGGYTGDNYFADNSVLRYNMNPGSGNQIRGFFANDRPSGTRFAFILNNGKINELNQKAFGGVSLGSSELIVKLKSNLNICIPEPSKGGKKTIKNKKPKSKLIKKSIKNKRNKNNNKSKKNNNKSKKNNNKNNKNNKIIIKTISKNK